MAHTLRFSDGSTTVDLLGSNYAILDGGGWSPRIARRNPDEMAGRSPYEDVTEEMAIKISGSSESDCLSKLQTLVELFDQVQAWKDDPDGNTAVYIEYEPDNSGLANSVKAVLVDVEQPALPRNFAYIYRDGRYFIGTKDDPVYLTFTRRGLWLDITGVETKSASATTGNPAIATTANFTNSMSILVPYDINITFSGTVNTGTGYEDMVVLTTNAANKLYFSEAESLTGGSSTANSDASGGNVHQAADSSVTNLYESSLSFPSGSRKFAWFAVVEPSGTTTQWSARARMYFDVTHGEGTEWGKSIIIDKVADKQILDLGTIATNWDPGGIYFTFTPDANNGENLKIDYVCGIALDESGNMLKIVQQTEGYTAGDQYKIVQNLATTGRAQLEVYEASSLDGYFGWIGSATPYASGNAISSLIFGINTTNKFIIYDYDNTQEANITFSATRYDAYLAPV